MIVYQSDYINELKITPSRFLFYFTTKMKVNIFLFTFLTVLPYTKMEMNRCGWNIEVVPFFQLMPGHQHYTQTLQEQLTTHIQLSSMLEYVLQLKAGCSGDINDNFMRNLIFRGVTPSVYVWIHNSEDGDHLSTSAYLMRSVLIKSNKSVDSDDVGSWYVPLPARNTSEFVRIRVVSDGITSTSFKTEITLNVAYLFQNKSQTKLDVISSQDAVNTLTPNLLKSSPLRIKQNFEAELNLMINLKNSTFLLASSDFTQHVFASFSPQHTSSMPVCTPSVGEISSIFLYRNFIFVATKFGLELRYNENVNFLTNICVSQFLIWKKTTKKMFLLLTSSLHDSVEFCGSVSIATFDPRLTRLPALASLVDKKGYDIKIFCLKSLSSSCCLVTSAMSSMVNYLYFLVFSTKTKKYHVIIMDLLKKSWSKFCSISPPKESTNFKLFHIYVHDEISRKIIYAYGTRIVYCDSKQVLFVNFPEEDYFPQIVELKTVFDDYIIVFTKDKELGIGKIGSPSVEFASSFLMFKFQSELDEIVALYETYAKKIAFLLLRTDKDSFKFDSEIINMESLIETFDYYTYLRETFTTSTNWQEMHTIPHVIEEVTLDIPDLIKFSGTKVFKLVPPDDNNEVNSLYSDREALYLYQGAASLISESEVIPGYHNIHKNTFAQWQYQKNKNFFNNKISIKDKNIPKWPYQLNETQYQQIYSKQFDNEMSFPPILYLDILDVFIMRATVKYNSNSSSISAVIKRSSSNVDYKITTIEESEKMTTFQVSLTSALPLTAQHLPGVGLLQVPVEFRFSSDENVQYFHPQSQFKTNVMLGCPPSKHLVFDWSRTIKRNQYLFRDNYDCWKVRRNEPCFSFHGEFLPVFLVVDDVAGSEEIYKDDYIFLVVGGGDADAGIRLFTRQEIENYNYLNGSEHHAIWRPSHHHHEHHDENDEHDEHKDHNKEADFHQHIFRSDDDVSHSSASSPIPLMNYDNSAIHWMCEWHSPCGNVNPIFPDESQFDLLIQISNRNLHVNNSYCDLTTQFVIRIHGLPASLIHKALPQLAVTMAFILVFFLFYHCFRVFRGRLNEELAEKPKVSPAN